LGSWLKSDQSDILVGRKNKTMTARSRAQIRFPIWNGFTIAVVNRLFMAMNKLSPVEKMGANKAIFPFANNSIYHRLYGRKGFAEIQVLVDQQFAETFVQKLHDLIEKYDPPLAMISLKMFRGKQESLSMSGEGYLIALNFYRNASLPDFLKLIDKLAIDTKAQPNISKDSRISSVLVSQTLPGYTGFKSRLQVFDSLRLYQSELSNRIGV
jgi:hypothetical protein